MNVKVDTANAEEWRQLGFWYDYTPKAGWILRGTHSGLLRLAEEIELYAADPRSAGISAHEHLGPYQYLKLVTWHEAEINPDGIYGLLEDLKRLATVVREKIANSTEGSTIPLSTFYSKNNKAEMQMHIEKVGFDPAAYDMQQRGEAT